MNGHGEEALLRLLKDRQRLREAAHLREQRCQEADAARRRLLRGMRLAAAITGSIGLLILLIVHAFASPACLTRQECIERGSGYCRHHAGCWHAGSGTRFAAHKRTRMPKLLGPNPHGDPSWTDIDVDPYGDPIWANAESKP